MLLRLQQYNFKVTYKSEKSLILADFLSRAQLQENHYWNTPDKGTIICQAEIEQIEALNRVNTVKTVWDILYKMKKTILLF